MRIIDIDTIVVDTAECTKTNVRLGDHLLAAVGLVLVL